MVGRSWGRVAAGGLSGVGFGSSRFTGGEAGLSERGRSRGWSAQQKLGVVLAGLRGDRGARGVCWEHAVSEALFCSWREKLLEGGREALAGKGRAARASGSCGGRSPGSSVRWP